MLSKLFIVLFFISNTYCNENSVCHNNNDLECHKSYDSTMYQELSVCKDSNLDLEAILECKIVKHKYKNSVYDAFNLTLKVNDNKSYLEEAYFEWSISEDKHNKSTELIEKSNRTLNFTLNNDTNRYEANLTIFNIEENEKYDIQAMFNNYTLKCALEYEVEEETTSLYMSLLVMGVMVVIYLIIGLVHWFCPPDKYRTLDELLANLPSKHVEALKDLVSDDINLAREFDELNQDNNHISHKKNVNFNMAGIENRAYADDVFNDDDDDDEDSINRKLYQEANKLRKMSRVSQHSSFNSEQKSRVRFTNIGSVGSETISIGSNPLSNLDHAGFSSTDLENLQLKIMREKRRRDSVHPFKKTYALTTIESSDSE